MVGSVDAAVEIHQPKGLYTNGDVVSGQVTVSLKKDTTVKSISVILHCKERAQIVRSYGQSVVVLDKNVKHYLVEQVVFPPDYLESGSAKTIGSGQHAFDFKLAFPNPGRALPETYRRASENYIDWEVKLHINRDGRLTLDTREREKVNFIPDRTPEGADNPETTQIPLPEQTVSFHAHKEGFRRSLSSIFTNKDRLDVSIRMRGHVSEYGLLQWPQKSTLNMTFEPTIPNVVLVNRVVIQLIAKHYTKIRPHQDVKTKKVVLYDVKPPNAVLGKSTTLNEILQIGPDEYSKIRDKVGSFEWSHHRCNYFLLFRTTFKSRHHEGYTKTRKVTIPVTLAPMTTHTEHLASYSPHDRPPSFSGSDDEGNGDLDSISDSSITKGGPVKESEYDVPAPQYQKHA